MLPETYAMLAARAETYWWHRARRRMSVALLRRARLRSRCRHLDLGSGPGGNLRLLEPFDPELVVGLDLSPIALDFARARSGTRRALVRADIRSRLPFADGSFDVVTVFNVLYHQWIESESAVLAEVARVLRRGGLFLITEPAFPMLAREMDRAAMGRKRYRMAEMTEFCQSAGLNVLHESYFTSFGFPALLAIGVQHRLTRRARGLQERAAADMRPLPGFANAALYLAARIEVGLIAAGIAVPFGTTLVCLARKT